MKSTRNICTMNGCEKYVRGLGYCNAHYLRFRRYGDPLATKAYLDPAEGFKARTRWDGDCLVWEGHKTDDGYGRMRAGGIRVLTHRYAWEAERGPIPEGAQLDHICRRPECCNVEHLRVVTNKQNSENKVGPNAGNRSSGVRGVHRHGNKWRARVRHYGKTYYGGRFATVAEAEVAAVALRNKLYTHNTPDRQYA